MTSSAHDEFASLQTEISLCRVYKRTGIDDGHGHPASARSTPSRGATAAQQQDNKQASSSSTPTPPTTPSKMMHLLHGECTSPPAAICRNNHAAAAHSDSKAAAAPRQQQQLPTKPYCNGYHQLSTASSAAAAAGDQQQQQQQAGTAAVSSSSYEQLSRNANYAFAASTYSLLSLVNAASMGGSGSAAAIDELSTLVGHVHGPPAYFNHQSGGGGHGHSFLANLPTPSSQQPMALGTLPMSLAAISDKIWDWNPIVPDAAARDYGSAGFK